MTNHARRALPVAAVLLPLVAIWHPAAMWMNHDAAASLADEDASALDVWRSTLSLDRPLLPAAHQVAGEILDGLFGHPITSPRSLADPAAVATLARFLQASLKGWQYAAAHQDEAVKTVLSNDTAGAQTAAHQKRMMGEVAKLLGADPVITKKPEGAWSHAVFDAASR